MNDNAGVDRSEHSDSGCDLCGPGIELARGGTLTLRHSTGDDVAGLCALYKQLKPNDLRRRFFTAGPPSKRFLERWTSLRDEAGFGLVAELVDDELSPTDPLAELSGGGAARLVGEAGYGRAGTEGDNYELGITVAPGSRGWLGPWLLDRLLAHAAERGIANLQAVVLTDNRSMLALAAKRGYVILDHPDRGLIRLAMSTSGSVPSWSETGTRPRVLIETDRTRWVGEEALTEAGYDIALCAEKCRGGHPCPVLQGEPCALIDGADAVIVDIRDAQVAENLLNHEQIVHPGIQQVVVDRSGHGRVDVDGLIDQLRDLLPTDPPSTDR